MKGFDVTLGHDFTEPFISYHWLRYQAGNVDSARWLRDNVKRAREARLPVAPHLLMAVERMPASDALLRRALQTPGRRGKRGAALGDHRQLLAARRIWQRANLEHMKPTRALHGLHMSEGAARNAYYRFMKMPERSILIVELKRYYIEQQRWLESLESRLAAIVRAPVYGEHFFVKDFGKP